jgi:hypothetical protein
MKTIPGAVLSVAAAAADAEQGGRTGDGRVGSRSERWWRYPVGDGEIEAAGAGAVPVNVWCIACSVTRGHGSDRALESRQESLRRKVP